MERIYTMKELQSFYLEMMKSFHCFCEEHGLTYYMVGGVLLGAVREGGFIPWDDDVDLAMPRPDYERLIREYVGEMNLLSMHNQDGYTFPYVKLFHRDHPTLRIMEEECGICTSVFVKIDIYPIDGLGNDIKTATNLINRIMRYKNLLYLNLTTDKSRRYLKNVILNFIRKLPTSWILNYMDRRMQMYDLTDSQFCTRWRGCAAADAILEKAFFGEPVLLPFENCSFFAPNQYGAYLTHVYGEYLIKKRENDGLRHDVNQNEISKRLERIVTKAGSECK